MHVLLPLLHRYGALSALGRLDDYQKTVRLRFVGKLLATLLIFHVLLVIITLLYIGFPFCSKLLLPIQVNHRRIPH